MALDSSLPTQSLLGPMAVEQVINILSYEIKITQNINLKQFNSEQFICKETYHLIFIDFCTGASK